MNDKLEILRQIPIGFPVSTVHLSMDGQYIAAGCRQGVSIVTPIGRKLLTYPAQGPWPLQKVTITNTIDHFYVVTREGKVISLTPTRNGDFWTIDTPNRVLYDAPNDIFTMSIADDESLLALGHHSTALTLLNKIQETPEVVWRRHREFGNATDGQAWVVSLSPDGKLLYLGSGGTGINRLVVMHAAAQTPLGQKILKNGERITGLTVLPGDTGVAAVINKSLRDYRLVAFNRDLSRLLWEKPFDEGVTALVGNRGVTASEGTPLLAAAIGFGGQVAIMNAFTGEELVAKTLHAMVNDLDFVQSKTLVAATDDGNIISMTYASEEEFRL